MFREMGGVTAHDLGRLTRFVASAEPGTPAEPIPRWLLAGLRDLIGADEAEFFEFRRTDRRLVAHAQSHDWPEASGSDEALRQFGHQNPLGWHRWRPADGPMRLSTRISNRALERLELHGEFLRPNGLTDILKVWLHSDDESVACIQLWLRGSVFSKRQEDLLGVLQHHLARTRIDAARPVWKRRSVAPLTRREAEVLSWAMTGASDETIGRRLGLAASTVGKHIEHAFAKLGVHSRIEALWGTTRSMASDVEPSVVRRRDGGRVVASSDDDDPPTG